MSASYDTIGVNYSDLRKPDARIEAAINRALEPAQTVLNVGAGTGSYEPADREVTALELSAEVISQRDAVAAPVVQAAAEDLPFADNAFDAAMAILTVHHWTDQEKGHKELRRVARDRVVLLTYDPAVRRFWLADYFPELVTLDEEQMPPMTDYAAWLGPVEITAIPIPQDCTDGFLCAYWKRPAAYLDPRIRAAISSFWKIGDLSAGLERLAEDLDSGAWAERYGGLDALDECDFGYRLVVTT